MVNNIRKVGVIWASILTFALVLSSARAEDEVPPTAEEIQRAEIVARTFLGRPVFEVDGSSGSLDPSLPQVAAHRRSVRLALARWIREAVSVQEGRALFYLYAGQLEGLVEFPEIREAFIFALRKGADGVGRPLLHLALTNPEVRESLFESARSVQWQTRRQAYAGLSRLAETDERALGILMRGTRDLSTKARGQAFRSLSSLAGTHESVREFLMDRVRRGSAAERCDAIFALGGVVDREEVRRLLETFRAPEGGLESEEAYQIRAVAEGVLGGSRGYGRDDWNWQDRLRRLRALGGGDLDPWFAAQIGHDAVTHPETRRALIVLAQDEVKATRSWARGRLELAAHVHRDAREWVLRGIAERYPVGDSMREIYESGYVSLQPRVTRGGLLWSAAVRPTFFWPHHLILEAGEAIGQLAPTAHRDPEVRELLISIAAQRAHPHARTAAMGLGRAALSHPAARTVFLSVIHHEGAVALLADQLSGIALSTEEGQGLLALINEARTPPQAWWTEGEGRALLDLLAVTARAQPTLRLAVLEQSTDPGRWSGSARRRQRAQWILERMGRASEGHGPFRESAGSSHSEEISDFVRQRVRVAEGLDRLPEDERTRYRVMVSEGVIDEAALEPEAAGESADCRRPGFLQRTLGALTRRR